MCHRCTGCAPTADGSISQCRHSGTTSANRSSDPPSRAPNRGQAPELVPPALDSSWLLPAVDIGATEGPSTSSDQRELGVVDLTHAGGVAELQCSLVMVVEAVDVALGQQPSVRVYYHVTAVGGAPGREELADFAFLAKAEALHGGHHRIGEAVVHAGHVHVRRSQACLFPDSGTG